MVLRSTHKRVLFVLVALCLLLGLFGLGFMAGNKYRTAVVATSSSSSSNSILAQLSKIMILPEQEPTIAQVVDANALKSQDPVSYKLLQNGDYLIVYSDQVIIFRPDQGRIVQILLVNK